tara:strand:- start:2017 stop:2526 length:510 start_codon:yes stop_codon:yes gene_type:complete
MKKFIIIFLALLNILEMHAQEFDLTVEQHVDSLNLWEFSFSKDTVTDEKIGTLILRRKENVYSKDGTRKITPKISFDIYPVSMTDSISKFESERMIHLSCCYPECGATIESTKNFVFWSDPWSITSALDCNGVDYTRKNAELILDRIINQSYNSIEELINDLAIEQIKN